MKVCRDTTIRLGSRIPWPCLLAVAVLLGNGPAVLPTRADDAASQDLEAIRKSADAFCEAYNAGDAKAVAALFTPAAEFVDGAGNVFHGREAIEAEYAAYFANSPGNKIVIDMDAVRFVSPGVLIEEGSSMILPPNDGSVMRGSYVVVHARQRDGSWQMASVRSERDEPLTAGEQLKQLEWLVGDWVDEGDDGIVVTSYRWSDDGNFLLSDFELVVEGQSAMRGSQRIGWDAQREQFRSWVFDSQGGFAEGRWVASGDSWIVKLEGTGADGVPASATNIFRPVSSHMLVWRSTDRLRDGERQPDVEVTVVRSAPPPASASANP